MSLHFTNNGNKPQQQQQEQQKQNPKQQQQQQQQAEQQQAQDAGQPKEHPTNPMPGFTAMSMALARPVQAGHQSAVLSAATTALGNWLRDEQNTYKTGFDLTQFNVIPLDAHSLALALPAVAVTYTVADKVFFYGMVLGQPSQQLPKRFVRINNAPNHEVRTVSGDVVDQLYLTKVTNFIAQASRVTPEQVVSAGFSVIPEDFVFDKETVVPVIGNATDAVITTAIDVTKTGDHFSLSMLPAEGAFLSVDLSTAPNRIVDYYNQPVRSDVTVRVSAQVKEPDQVIQRELVEAQAMLNLVYAPQFRFGAPRQQQDTCVFHPQINLTRISSMFANTPELMLTALAAVNVLDDNHAWLSLLDPRMAFNTGRRVKGKWYGQDIGAIGCLDPSMEKFDTSSAMFLESSEPFHTLVQHNINPNVAVGLQVGERDDLNWIQQLFLRAANGEIEANNAIVIAADRLTSGRFSQIWGKQEGVEIAGVEDNRIINGWFVDTDGERRDLREVDALYLLNAGVSNATFMEWHDTMVNTSVHVDVRVGNRIRILEELLGRGSVHITGFSRQIFFSPAFRNSLAAAIHGTGRSFVRGDANYAQTVISYSNVAQNYSSSNVGSSLFVNRQMGGVETGGYSYFGGKNYF